jgi:hypothetical protein
MYLHDTHEYYGTLAAAAFYAAEFERTGLTGAPSAAAGIARLPFSTAATAVSRPFPPG